MTASSALALAVYLQDTWGNLATAQPFQLAVSFALQGGDTFAASIDQVRFCHQPRDAHHACVSTLQILLALQHAVAARFCKTAGQSTCKSCA